MKFQSIVLIGFCILFSNFSISVYSQSTIAELDQIADEALRLTRFDRFEEAKGKLEYFGELFAQGVKDSESFSMDELRIITTTHSDALGAMTSVSLDKETRLNRVTAFRLAIDAVTSEHQPIWTEMEMPVLKAFQNVKNAVLEGDSQSYNEQLNKFLATYSVIQPSIKIDLSAEKVQKLDSKITFIERYRSKYTEEEWVLELDKFEEDLKKIFSDMRKDELDPSVWWVMIMTGSIIVSTLSYVSYRKYTGQKKQKKRDKPFH